MNCPLCHSPSPSHYVDCWELVTPSPASEYAPHASVVAMDEVLLGHRMEAEKLRLIARKCLDRKTKQAILERAAAHESLSHIDAGILVIVNPKGTP